MNLKRLFDAGASALGLIALSPVFAVVAVAGALHFRGNPIHLAARVGKDGQDFKMLKFKSLIDQTQDSSGRLLNEEDRTTGFGRFLRTTALDELPQLVNILKGDMSIVGPRPRAPGFHGVDYIPPAYKDILSVRPGLTGPWQVAAIGSTEKNGTGNRLIHDLDYVRSKPSLSKDLLLMLKTLPAFIKGHDGESLSLPHPKKLEP